MIIIEKLQNMEKLKKKKGKTTSISYNPMTHCLYLGSIKWRITCKALALYLKLSKYSIQLSYSYYLLPFQIYSMHINIHKYFVEIYMRRFTYHFTTSFFHLIHIMHKSRHTNKYIYVTYMVIFSVVWYVILKYIHDIILAFGYFQVFHSYKKLHYE